jgi:hypothetical protein
MVGVPAGIRRQREVGQGVAEPPLHLCAHPLGTEVVDHELQPRLDARDAVAEVLLPGVEQRAQDGQRLVDADEHPEVARDARHGGEPSADEDAEPVLAAARRIAAAPDQGDAVDLRRVAPVGARGDGDLVLARQVRVVGVPVEEARHLVQHGRHVEELVLRDPRERAARGVAHGVAAAARGRQTDAVELGEDRRKRGEREVVELDRLPGRQLAGALAVLVGELADGAELRRGDATGGQLDPQHERADLRLVVVEAPPLHADDVLLGDVRVARRDQRGELAEDPERALLALQPLDGVALEDQLEGGRLGGATARAPRTSRPLARRLHRHFNMYSDITSL